MFLFEEVFKETIWGGDRISNLKGRFLPSSDIGESWELSSLDGHETLVSEGPAKGKSLRELSATYGASLLGIHVYNRYGTDFPLLIKFIDAHADLSIQVHPDDEMARRLHGCNGKTEMWYVVDATPEGRLLVGFDHAMTADTFSSALSGGHLASTLRSHHVKRGDVFFLPPGRVHAACTGVLLAEIQQSSDITYRLYDYGRKDRDGKERELHIPQALEALDFSSQDDYQTHYDIQANTPTNLVSCDYFSTSLLQCDTPMHIDISQLDSFCILICVEGELKVTQSGGLFPGESVLKEGHTILIPASSTSVELEPLTASKLLQVWVP